MTRDKVELFALADALERACDPATPNPELLKAVSEEYGIARAIEHLWEVAQIHERAGDAYGYNACADLVDQLRSGEAPRMMRDTAHETAARR